MSRYLELSDEDRIRICKDAVRCGVPIAPALVSWLHEKGLYDRVTNPRKVSHAEHDNPEGGSEPAGEG